MPIAGAWAVIKGLLQAVYSRPSRCLYVVGAREIPRRYWEVSSFRGELY